MSVFDAEFDGLDPSKIHVLSYEEGGDVFSLTNDEEIKEWLVEQTVLVGHNIVCFDVPHLERLLGIKITARLIDTLWLSWYLEPNRQLHGLDSYGKEAGIPKPVVTDWSEQPLEVYVNRCSEDVRINTWLWKKQKRHLSVLYESEKPASLPIVHYLMFKASCAREQERSKWRLDIPWCTGAYERLDAERQPKLDALFAAMPPVTKYQTKIFPAKPYKKDGTPSVEGVKWQKYIREQGLTKTHTAPISVAIKEERPNPGSPDQVKAWLFSFGWDPVTFKFVKNDDGSERKIPQIKLPDSPDLCPSVLELAEEFPIIHELAGLSVLKHRLEILKGFLKNVDDEGFLKARAGGLTNTLRLKHREIVNLPGVDKPYGEEIRGCLIAREGYELLGSDITSLEDSTKKHYMFTYDPDYVEEMSAPDFDPHLDLANRTGAISDYDLALYKDNKNDKTLGDNLAKVIQEIVGLRKTYKVVNYSSVYGIGPPKLARALKCTVAAAKQLLKGYWERNWAVLKIAEDCIVKRVNGQMWLFNPVSRFWYSLRADKDRFSTLNQGTGVYVFDSWVKEVLLRRPQLTGQFHDEFCLEVKLGNRDRATKLVKDAMQAVNDKLKLNVKIGCSIDYGHRYSEIH